MSRGAATTAPAQRADLRPALRCLLAATLLIVTSCTAINRGSAGVELAADQTLRFPIIQDVNLDPGRVGGIYDSHFILEVFSGLYKFDNDLRMVPDIATGPPDVSADGLTYTFRLRHDVKFSNGDRVTARDFVYSWNRAVYIDENADGFVPLVGAADTRARKTTAMKGLVAPDDYTLKATVRAPAGYWLSWLAYISAFVVDQNVIERSDGTNIDDQNTWWTRPQTAIGTGPFKLTQRTLKTSMAFAPVSDWYGGSTGALKSVKVEIGPDQSTVVKKYESGGYDVVGMGRYLLGQLGPDDVLRYKNDPAKKSQLHQYSAGSGTWIAFNELAGAFGGLVDGHDGRQAFSMAIDRDQLVQVACAGGTTCQKATGGVIPKGLKGYLGDGKDTNAAFDPARARVLYSKWDPTGSKVAGLQYHYSSTTPFAPSLLVAQNVQAQWQANLGVKVDLVGSDNATLFKDAAAKTAPMFQVTWRGDVDHPSIWFDFLFTCSVAPPGQHGWEAYCNPAMDVLLQRADAEPIDDALPLYQQAGQMMVDDAVNGVLYYNTFTFLIKPYVHGVGRNAINDSSWTSISIAKH